MSSLPPLYQTPPLLEALFVGHKNPYTASLPLFPTLFPGVFTAVLLLIFSPQKWFHNAVFFSLFLPRATFFSSDSGVGGPPGGGSFSFDVFLFFLLLGTRLPTPRPSVSFVPITTQIEPSYDGYFPHFKWSSVCPFFRNACGCFFSILSIPSSTPGGLARDHPLQNFDVSWPPLPVPVMLFKQGGFCGRLNRGSLSALSAMPGFFPLP